MSRAVRFAMPVWALSTLLSLASLLIAAPAAHAAPAAGAAAHAATPAADAASSVTAEAEAADATAEQVVTTAAAQRGKPYRRGAQGPNAFDCSGLTSYVFHSVQITLPRTANAQFHAAHPVSKANARPGDLVFWVNGRHAYHVGIYAGDGQVWHAPKTGDHVRLAKIWSWREVHFGRVT
ncbi:cell wall-associated NlpC family hydrolase [Actinoplanes tereljensis]|uniref:NlpC/P60 domain-containing protein n=1 Tax=Paractinoplanes tereljensis TaxID=571912 RepID=A0A919TWN2_9ACTN|nr:C40 family peptidase [Actinoplanes tereljensis]GIF26178.1 hypothetical protein Ate02nite_89080 [Actinoplanes tereljensis]